MNFFRTLFQVCSGPSVFLQLMNRSLWRAVLHLVLLIFLLSFGLAALNALLSGGEIRRVSHALCGQIGGIALTKKDGMRTLRNPEQRQSYLLNRYLRFDYLPSGTFTPGMTANWDSPMGILVSGRVLLTWFRDSSRPKRMIAVLNPLDLRFPASFPHMKIAESSGEFEDYLASCFKAAETGADLLLPYGIEQLAFDSGEVLASRIISVLWAVVFIIAFAGMLLIAFAGILFFSLAQYFWSAGSAERRISFRTTLVIMTYAAFPPLIAAALCSGLVLPVLSFQTVFFIAFFLYHLLVFNRLQKLLDPPKDKHDGDRL